MQKSMETEFVTDAAGAPVRVKMTMDYQDYVKIAGQLNLPLTPTSTVQERNPLDWYSQTESAKSIINGLIALASREHMNELDKPNPDQKKVAAFVALRDEAIKVSRDDENFASLEKMDRLIEKYGPILLAEKKKLLI